MKEAIIQKCLREFQKRGIRKMTLHELVAILGISTKTLYKYFTDKESLLTACLDSHYTQMYDNFIKTSDLHKSPIVRLFRIWITAAQLDFGTAHIFYEDLNYYYPALQDRIIKRNSKKFGAPIIKLMEEGLEKGLFRKELIPPVVLETSGAIYALLTRSTGFKKFRLNSFQLAENTIGVYLRGLCTAKGLQELESHRSLISFTHNS